MATNRQRAPRRVERDYKGFVAGLPCLACLVAGPTLTRPVQVAHLRAGSLEHGKRPTGGAEKPDDRWTLPLCWPHHQGHAHRVGRHGAQHEQNEEAFWEGFCVDPFDACVELGKAFDADKPGLPVLLRIAAKARKEKFA